MRAALKVAGRFEAHVRALFVKAGIVSTIPYVGEGLTGAMVENIVQAARRAADESLVAAREHVETALKEGGLEASRLSIRVIEGVLEDEVAAASRLADLVVYARDPADAAFPDRSLAEHTLLGARRPILIAPPGALPTLGERIAILWDGGSAAAAAVIAALPFLQHAASIEVIHVGPDEEGCDAVLDDLNDALSLRGIVATMRAIDRRSTVSGAALMSAALVAEPDMLVMGGYGHSRLRQLVLGGVTRHMLRHAPVPVLMAH